MQGETRKRLLVMQPEGGLLSLLTDVFGKNGVEVHVVEKASDVVSMATECTPDVLLLNSRRDVAELFGICWNIREHPALKDVPLFIISKEQGRAARLGSLRAGADDYISYPLDGDELVLKLRNLLKSQRFRREIAGRDVISIIGEQSTHGVLLLDRQGRVTYANHAAETNLEVTESVDATWLVQLSRRFNLCKANESPITTDAFCGPQVMMMFERGVPPDSSPKWYRCVQFPFLDDPEGRQLVVILDMTARLGMQDILLGVRRLLMHKVRTPLNGLLAPLELLQTDVGMPYEEREACLSLARECADELLHVVERMEEYMSDSPSEDSMGKVSVGQLESVIRGAAEDLHLAGLQFSINADLETLFPIGSTRMGVIFTELLDNAVKFHPSHVPVIDIVVTVQNSLLCVDMIDDGCHVPDKDIQFLYLPFYQGDSGQAGNVGGSGIGLAQVERIIYEAGGQIRFQNRMDGPGTKLSIRFPITLPEDSKKDDKVGIVKDRIPSQ